MIAFESEPQLRCPTCKARQAWSDSCRRCKCDLSLIHGLLEKQHELYNAALQHLSQGRVADARRSAQECHQIRPDAATARLLAVASVADNDCRTAFEVLSSFANANASPSE